MKYKPCPTGACPKVPHDGNCGCKCHKPEPKCEHKDDLFARTNEGEGYFQCQVHLRRSHLCNRPQPEPKEAWEDTEEWHNLLVNHAEGFGGAELITKYVRRLLASEHQKLRLIVENIEKGIQWMQEGRDKNRKGYTLGYNQALEDILDSLK